MGLARDSALLTTAAQVAALTGVQNLENVEAAAQVTVANGLLAAHRWVFDRLRRRFTAAQLATISNTEALELAVACRFLEFCAGAGVLVGDASARAVESGPREYWGKQARDEVDSFAPEFASYDAPRRSSEGIPAVGHVDASPMFFGDPGMGGPTFFGDDYPSAR